MKIKILGTRGNIKLSAPHHILHSGVLIDDTIMIDVGERRFLKYNPSAIFITHLHPDHAFFIHDRNFTPGVPVYAPEAYDRISDIQVMYNSFNIKGYTITPIPVAHSLNVKSVAYIVEKGERRILYTGDVAEFHGKISLRFDAVVTEASFIRRGGLLRYKDGQPFGHLGVPDLVEFFKPYTNLVIFTHFGSWFMKDPAGGVRKIKALESESLNLKIAGDGSEYRL